MMSVSVPVRRPTMIRTLRGGRPATAALTRSSAAFDRPRSARRPRSGTPAARADLPDRREHARQRAAIDDGGRGCRAPPAASRPCAGRRGRTRDPARAARSSRRQASGRCRPSAAAATACGIAAVGRHADDAIAEAEREQRLGDARRGRHDPRGRAGRRRAAPTDATSTSGSHARREPRSATRADRSPRARPAIAGLSGHRAQRSVDAGVVFELAAEQPQEVGEAIEVGEDRRLHHLAGFAAAARRRARRAGRWCAPRRTRPPRCARREPTSPTGCPRWPRADGLPRSAARRAPDRSATCGLGLSGGVARAEPTLKSSFWMLCVNAGDRLVLADRSREAERRVQLVDVAVGLDANRGLGHPDAAGEAGLSCIAARRAMLPMSRSSSRDARYSPKRYFSATQPPAADSPSSRSSRGRTGCSP